MCKKILFLLLYLAVCKAQNLFAQTLTGPAAGKMVTGSELVVLNPKTHLPTYVEFASNQGPKADEFAMWLKRNLNLTPALGLSLMNTEKDQIGFEHFRYGQTYNGLAVNHSMLIVHVKNGQVSSFNGDFVTTLFAKTEARLSESSALEMAKKSIGADAYKWELKGEEAFIKREQNDPKATFFPTGEKMLVKNKKDQYVLAYRFDIYAHKPLSRQYVYVDASTGDVLATENRIHETNAAGTATTAYSGVKPITTDFTGATYRLRETGRGLGIRTYNMRTAGSNYGAAVDFTDADNNWNNVNANKDQFATDAHFGAEMTYDYFKIKHLRNGIDGAGYALNNYVHANLLTLGFPNNVNAFWDGTRMTYGDGDGIYKPLTALDIVGHEITHGLTENTAKLTHAGEPGALNEGFSDIFGTAIEFYGKTGNAGNWTIGEGIGPRPFRSLSNPNGYDDPDTYKGNHWWESFADAGGVHHNNGVLNYWFYLLSQGGNGVNDFGNAYKVNALGMSKATLIAYRTLTVYLSQNSDYAQARLYSIQSAKDLYGACSFEVIATTNAWFAVGVGSGILPAVITSSGPLALCKGSGVYLTATPGAVSYQWKFNGVNIPGAVTGSYGALAAGGYTVATTYCGASFISPVTTVTITTPAVTISPAVSVSACYGGAATLAATSIPGTTLQWNKNGAPIFGASSPLYFATTAGSYTVTAKSTSFPTISQNSTGPVPISAQVSGCSEAFSEITISGVTSSYLSSGISVTLNITQDEAQELSIFLESPDGQILGLIKNQVPYHFNFTNTVFSDDGVPANTGGGFFTGTFQPYPYSFTSCLVSNTKTTFGSLGFQGKVNPNGTWRLRVFNPTNNEGSVDSWQITFASYFTPTPHCDPVTSAPTIVSILPAVNLGTIASGDQTLCANGDPNPVSLSVLPSGSGSFTSQWYYQSATSAPCPVGNSTTGWAAINLGTPSYIYDPQSAGTAGRTFALFVTPTGIPTCGTPGWATGCRKVFVGACREAVNGGFDAVTTEVHNPAMEQNTPNPWKDETHFSVFLPEDAKEAEIRIMGLDGRLHKIIPVTGTGNQEVKLIKGDLANGQYLYSLWTNQQPVAIKKMVLIR